MLADAHGMPAASAQTAMVWVRNDRITGDGKVEPKIRIIGLNLKPKTVALSICEADEATRSWRRHPVTPEITGQSFGVESMVRLLGRVWEPGMIARLRARFRNGWVFQLPGWRLAGKKRGFFEENGIAPIDRLCVNSGLMKILLADDDPIMHRILAHQLGREGISVESAFNGREALEMAGRSLPDLLILDGMMPEMDGFAVLREWRTREALRNIPVMMLTARNREGDVVGALGEGAVDYLTKPFSPAELVARVKRLMCSGDSTNP